MHRDGCFADYITFPAENAFVCDPNLPIEVLSLMEPLGAAVHAALEFPLAGQTVAVLGCGPIGLMAMSVAKKTGAAFIIAVEPNELRSSLALKMGAHVLVNPTCENPSEAIKNLTGGLGVDIVLEFSGNKAGIEAAFTYLRPEGKMAAVSLPAQTINFDFAEFVYRGLTIKGIAGRKMYESWGQMAGLLQSGLDISPVITHVLPLKDYDKGLHFMQSGECGKTIFTI
ncbi:MAG: zinc-binding dehydrogenase [Candidatus Adiutrix sp.]